MRNQAGSALAGLLQNRAINRSQVSWNEQAENEHHQTEDAADQRGYPTAHLERLFERKAGTTIIERPQFKSNGVFSRRTAG